MCVGGGITVKIEDMRNIPSPTGSDMAIVIASYRDVVIAYDLMDGYQDVEGMKYWIEHCDVYFKRSFSNKLNKQYFESRQISKMHKLGMNYLVTYNNNPYNNVTFNTFLKALLGKKMNSYFTPDVFECTPMYKIRGFKILFMTRLWETPAGENVDNQGKYQSINNMRIAILREMRKEFGDAFYGGLHDSKLARKLAPDLVISKYKTERKRYIDLLKSTDICIGTTGLHGSIGWKTAEYTAAGKAIICEPLQYDLPGDYLEGKNYLTFTTVEECVNNVRVLIENPEKLYDMKICNLMYYYQWLRPDRLVKNTLDVTIQNRRMDRNKNDRNCNHQL